MAKRLIDVILGATAIVLTAPLLAAAALGIRLSSPGPVFYRGERVGRHRRPFRMFKFRTMHAANGKPASAITAQNDPRVFGFGRWLRRSKIDELPQLFNVLRGEMSIVGPRPEDPKFVDAHYTREHLETLDVRPGLASPGSIYNYTHGEAMLTGDDAERRYVEQLLPVKLALDVVYVRGASLWYDVRIVGRTVGAILGTMLGRRRFPEPPEMTAARRLVETEAATTTPALIGQLSEALRNAGVAHCQWKGHLKRERWATGDGDIDLLIDAAGASVAAATLAQLGFRQAKGDPNLALPGAVTFLGCDPGLGRLLNVHVHDRVVIGEPWRTHYTMPASLTQAFLGSARTTEPFPLPLPAPELEYLGFVVRATLRHRRRDSEIQRELEYLEGRTEAGRVMQHVGTHLPSVSPALFAACRDALRPSASSAERREAVRALRRALHPFAQRPTIAARMRLALRHLWTARGRIAPLVEQPRLEAGGRLVSLVGGDGAGKSTCVRELSTWLGSNLTLMTAHLGRPPRSLLTLCVGAALKVRNAILGPAPDPDALPARFPGYLGLMRLVCTARDRYLLYARARRFATAGGIALCERHPIPQNRPLAGPMVDGFVPLAPIPRLAARLAALERRYYNRIPAPDALFVLRVDPELAVRRKSDEPADYVRRRARIVWDTDWTGSGARVIDAGRPLPHVLRDLKTAIWTAL